MNRPARRAVYQDVTGWGGRRRAVRAGSRMGIGRHAASGNAIPAIPQALFGIITTPAGIVAVNDGAHVLELFGS